MKSRFLAQFFKFLGGNVFLTAANLVRDTSIAAAFGRTQATDHFFLAVTLLIFLVTVFANACRSVYVPTLQSVLQQSPNQFEAIARRLTLNNIRLLSAISAVLSIGAGLLMVIASRLTDSLHEDRIMTVLEIIPMYAFSAFVEGSQGQLQVKGKIFGPGLMRLGLPLGIIIGVITCDKTLGIHAIAIGGLAGSFFSACVIALMLYRSEIFSFFAPKLPLSISRNVLSGALALTASSCIAYVTPVIDIWMASFLGNGAASTLGYASRLTVGVASLLVGSLAPVFLHRFSQQVASNNSTSLNAAYSSFVAIAPWVGAAATIGTVLFSHIITTALYQRGQFTPKDTARVAELINVYALQYPFFLTCTAGFTLISALSKNQAFIRLNLILLATDILCNVLFMHFFGIKGIALTTVVVYAVSLVSMNIYLAKNDLIQFSRTEAYGIAIPLLFLLGCLYFIHGLGLKISMETTFREYQCITAVLALFAIAAYLSCRSRITLFKSAFDQIV